MTRSKCFLPHTWKYQRCGWQQAKGGMWGKEWGTRMRHTWMCGNSGSGNGRSALEAAPVVTKEHLFKSSNNSSEFKKPCRKRKWCTGDISKWFCCHPVDKIHTASHVFADRLLLPVYLQQIFKLVDAETQLSHARFEQFPQTVLLHQTHKNTKRLLLWHLEEVRQVSKIPSLLTNQTLLMLLKRQLKMAFFKNLPQNVLLIMTKYSHGNASYQAFRQNITITDDFPQIPSSLPA